MARPRQDPAVLEASGAYAKNPNRRPKDMPVFVAGAPEMPKIVAEDSQARWYWNWCCQVLSEAGVLTTACAPLLTIHALDWAQLMWLYEHTKEGNVRTIGATGGPITTPEASQLHLHANRFLKELTEFGLTPASKTKVIAAGGKKDADPLAEMLARRMRPLPN
jgi:phage terminase small subunit